MMRIGEMINIRPEKLEEYKYYHANPWPEVTAMIKACGIQNYTIFQRGEYLFAYYEYTGSDFEADMAKMAADPKTREWWDLVKPFQKPLEDRSAGEWWSGMQDVFHLD